MFFITLSTTPLTTPAIEYHIDLSGEADGLAPHKCVRLELRSLLLSHAKVWYDQPQGGMDQDQRTLEIVKRPSVSETTSFIWATESMRSFTVCVLVTRAIEYTLDASNLVRKADGLQ